MDDPVSMTTKRFMPTAPKEMAVADGTTMTPLPLGTRVRHKEHSLLGTIKDYEWNAPGVLSPIPYKVYWDENDRAAELLGWFFIYPLPESFEVEAIPDA